MLKSPAEEAYDLEAGKTLENLDAQLLKADEYAQATNNIKDRLDFLIEKNPKSRGDYIGNPFNPQGKQNRNEVRTSGGELINYFQNDPNNIRTPEQIREMVIGKDGKGGVNSPDQSVRQKTLNNLMRIIEDSESVIANRKLNRIQMANNVNLGGV